MRYNKAPARRLRITELIRESGFCRSSELSEIFGVSEMTVRRDIHRLAEQGLVQEVHGGAKAVRPEVGSTDFRLRLEKNREAKQAVARRASAFVEPHSIVALDAGTTVLELAQVLPREMRLTVVTHSLPIMTTLSSRENIELIGLGGVLQKRTQAYAGLLTLLTLNEVRVSTLFLGTAAIQDGAMYSGNPYETEVKRALIHAADKVILLVDSSKFRASAGIRVAPLEDVDVIVVDDATDVSAQVKAENVELIVVSLNEES